MDLKNSRLVTGLFLEAVALCLVASFLLVDVASTATLFIFNVLFLSLTIYLNGSLNQKMFILTLGNLVGLFWNFALHYFSAAGIAFFGEPFNVFYAISYPFLNFMWVVSFWSLSLAVLPKPKNTQPEVTP